MKKTMWIASLLSLTCGMAYALGGTGVSEGPVILTPRLDEIANFANQNLPPACRPVDADQVNEVGPIGKNNMEGFIYSFATDCQGIRRHYRVETSGGWAPQPEQLILVK